ncbi:MAG: carbohydrate kinase family protein [Anaerolineae bacterium]|jgi:sugar/nucleoside kinase (ribokinase family)
MTRITNSKARCAKKTLVLGSVSFNTLIYLDEFPQPKSQTVFSKGFHETLGGSGAGKALNLGKLGLAVTFHSLIGDDEYGDKIKRYMAQEKMNFIYDVDPQGTRRHVNLMDQAGKRISIFIAYGTPDLPVSLDESLISQSDYVVLGLPNHYRRFIPLTQGHGKEIWLDIHDYDGVNPYYQDFIEAADYVFMSSDAMPDYKTFMEKLMDKGKKLVVCTHGRDGSTALTFDGQWIHTPIIPHYERKDTNGAGDSFFSGFLYGHSQGYPTQKCLRMGTIVSGMCITSFELAFPGLSAHKVERAYKKHYYGEEG